MKLIFMGTPDFAVGALEAIVQAGYEVVCAVTQPDKPKGRGKEMQPPPVKVCALRHGIPVFQPEKIKTPEATARLASYGADLYVVAAFGQILSQQILDQPRLGCVNIHASLLPRYRGAAPIQRALIDGEKETGITIMRMDAGLDTGDMLLKRAVPILDTDTGESLHDRLSQAGAQLIVEALPQLEAGTLTGEKQREEDASYAGMLRRDMGKIDWTRPAAELSRLVRGLNPWPSAYTFFRGRMLKIWEARAVETPRDAVAAGSVTAVGKDCFRVAAGDGALEVSVVQLEGKRKMAVRDFLLGNPLQPGEVLGAQTPEPR